MEDALEVSVKKSANMKIIPFVCTYNPSLPNIGKILNNYWNLLKLSLNESVKQVYSHKPLVAFKRPRNLQDILVHTNLNNNKNRKIHSVMKCNRKRCTHCNYITETNGFTSSTLGKQFTIKNNLNCASSSVIYLITCKKCLKQYVGQTNQKCSQRMNSHKFDIKHFPDCLTNVSEHFNSAGHSIDDFSFVPIEQIQNNWKRLLKECSWMHYLGTIAPLGMNSKVLF